MKLLCERTLNVLVAILFIFWSFGLRAIQVTHFQDAVLKS